ncbi:MAG: WYL domain-containing protein [Campylobacter sp.]|nr:WYL domain-containing protein [Campylobacter sp.]
MQRSYDKLSTRLAQILIKLNNGETFSLNELQEEFNISKRTIGRDIKERLSDLPIKFENGRYGIEPYALGKLSFKDIQKFAALCGIKSMFPSLDKSFISDILSEEIDQVYLIKSQNFQDLEQSGEEFKAVSEAIISHRRVTCVYNDKPRTLNPYKLTNINGIWYLLADDDGKLKSFTFSKIVLIRVIQTTFKQNNNFIQKIQNSDMNWFSDEIIKVTLEIKPQAVSYFLRKKILPNQKIISQDESALVVSTNVSYDDEILRIVKYWLPFIRIIEPKYLQEKLLNTLKEYVKDSEI